MKLYFGKEKSKLMLQYIIFHINKLMTSGKKNCVRDAYAIHKTLNHPGNTLPEMQIFIHFPQ